ncbi:hypothetical protein SERLADRAFT_434054 [Serpula lacrymans var. lacrymans S7.9]|uniref:Uncharacterized protein n=1 Tax=Serpula lacrymans var. lacrymans (strain S7.9) TaxID=578457 RepID=F8NLL3_SERL9|nr:uncharacterized protein SERLADRAFT_434054 [Serpula lacrymans var. lacrymans S7.9]EGO28194.1 hypothetical protein SERLADRAFT_434054 [Serpula lacrymans var. lacrymans S7.9]
MYQKVPQLCYCKLDWYANHVVPINSKKMAVKKEAVQADTCEYVAVHKDNYKQSHQDNPPICPAKQKNSPLASKVTTSSDAQASTLTSPNEMAIESGTTRVEPISSIQNMANNPPNDPLLEIVPSRPDHIYNIVDSLLPETNVPLISLPQTGVLWSL